MTERAVRSRWTRWARRLILGFAVLVLLILSLAGFFVGTAPGGRMVLSVARGFLPDDLHAEMGEFSGRLINRFELRGVELRLPGAEVAVRRVTVDWRGSGLLRKRVHVNAATVEGVVVRLPEGKEDSAAIRRETVTDSLRGSPVPELPVRLSFSSLALSDITVQVGDSVWVFGASAVVAGELDDYRLSLSGHLDVTHLASADVMLSGQGSTTGFHLDSLVASTSGGRVSALGALSWWPELTWDGDFEVQELAPSRLAADLEEWPGWISLSGSSDGRITSVGAVELNAVVDTVFGELRGERLGGSFEARLRGQDLELPEARIEWGGAFVRASGAAGETLDLEFEARLPQLGLVFPGSSGRLVASGHATGSRDAPRLRADFEADGVVVETARAASVAGELDLDMAGPLGATVFARGLSIAGREFGSAQIELSGRRAAHRLEISSRGSGGEVDFEAVGGLDPNGVWTGDVKALRLTADTVGSWALVAPAAITVSTDVLRLGKACLASAPALICAEGETGGGWTRLTASVDSFQVERLAPLMPDNVQARASVEGALSLEIDPQGRLSGEAEILTGPGAATLPVRGESRDLFFEPVHLSASSGREGTRAALDLRVTDASGARILKIDGRIESPVAIGSTGDLGRLRGQPGSAVLEIEAGDLRLVADGLPPEWDISGSARARADVQVDAEGRVTGELEAHTSAGLLTLPVGTELREFFFEPVKLTASSGGDGIRAEIDLHVADAAGAAVLDIIGRADSPIAIDQGAGLSQLRGRPVSAHLDVAADALLLVGDLLPLWDATGTLQATADLEMDAEGLLVGDFAATTDSLVLRSSVRGEEWTLVVEPARMKGEIRPNGSKGEVEFAVIVPGQGEILTATGQVDLPGFSLLDFDADDQRVDGSLDVRVADLSIVEAFLVQIADVRGRFELLSRFGGTLAGLTVDGEASLTDGYALVPALGLHLTDISLHAAGRPDGTVELEGEVRSGDGSLTLSGRSQRYPSAESPSVFQVRGERFLVVDIPEVNLSANPRLDLAFDGSSLRLSGIVDLPRGRLGFPEVPPGAVTPSDDVVIVGDSLVDRQPPVLFGADITVTLGDDVFFNGFGLAANLVGDVRILQEPGGEPRGRGEVRLVNGTYRSLGQELRVDPGRLLFSGPIDDPGVDARAFVRASDGTEAGFMVGGTVQDLDVSTYSVPPKPESDVMAYILFGRPMSQTSGTEGSRASNAAALLGANMLTMSLAPSLGLDEARIETGTSQNKAQLVVGKYLSPSLYVGYGIGIYEPISTLRLRYLLSARWSIEAITGDQQSTDLLWRIETGGPKPEAATAEGDGGATVDADVQ